MPRPTKTADYGVGTNWATPEIYTGNRELYGGRNMRDAIRRNLTQGPPAPARPLPQPYVPPPPSLPRSGGITMHGYGKPDGSYGVLTPKQFRKVKRAEELASKMGGIAKRSLGGSIGRAFEIADLIDYTLDKAKRNKQGYKAADPEIELGGWIHTVSCNDPVGYNCGPVGIGGFSNDGNFPCLDFQAGDGPHEWGPPPAGFTDNIWIWAKARSLAGQPCYTSWAQRWASKEIFWRPPGVDPTNQYPRMGYPTRFASPGDWMFDPNLQRAVAQMTSRNVPVPRPLPPPANETAPYVRREVAVSGGSGDAPPRFVAPNQGYTPHRPPSGRTRERKGMSRSAEWGVRVAKILDGVSESAELVDAFYNALPEDVRRRWEAGREERPGDNMGQYGLDGADWKLQALYYNWHKVDLAQAIANATVNRLEDGLYGLAHGARDKARPRNMARALGG